MMILSITKVLEKANGPTGLQTLLERCGQPVPTLPSISMMKSRNRIPGYWAGAFVYALACAGVHPLHLVEDTAPPRASELFDGVADTEG